MGGLFGAFGKIPALGDFFRIAPPVGFVEVWDGWLQHGILDARAWLGTRWDGCYLSAPIWRFSLGAGLAGPLPVVGVLMPSVDRVGRQFPLTLMAAVAHPPPGFHDHATTAATFEALETIALRALDDDHMRRETLAALLAEVTLPAPDAGPGAASRPVSHWSAITDAAGHAVSMTCAGLPDAAHFIRLVDIGPFADADADAEPDPGHDPDTRQEAQL